MTITERKRLRSPHQPTGRWITVHKPRSVIFATTSCEVAACLSALGVNSYSKVSDSGAGATLAGVAPRLIGQFDSTLRIRSSVSAQKRRRALDTISKAMKVEQGCVSEHACGISGENWNRYVATALRAYAVAKRAISFSRLIMLMATGRSTAPSYAVILATGVPCFWWRSNGSAGRWYRGSGRFAPTVTWRSTCGAAVLTLVDTAEAVR